MNKESVISSLLQGRGQSHWVLVIETKNLIGLVLDFVDSFKDYNLRQLTDVDLLTFCYKGKKASEMNVDILYSLLLFLTL